MTWKNAMEWYAQGVLSWSAFYQELNIEHMIAYEESELLKHYAFTFEGDRYEAIVRKKDNLILTITY